MGIAGELLKQEICDLIMRKALIILISGLLMAFGAVAQENGNRLVIGGYGEVALSRHFYSDNVYRYSHPDNYKNDKSHGRFDIPHAVIYLGYDFGKGWTMQSEIEFEHTGTGSAVEKEYTEAGEWETEIEKGGEVELEQFWIQKSFARALNVRMGHFVVPVGGLNNAPAITKGRQLPRYRNQKIYPYTDMIQHRLFMKNGIHGSWFRTTPLWGRGLSRANTGSEDRIHDCSARNVIEAIMWHGYSRKSDAYESTEKFYNLSKEDRDAVVEFINSL